MTNEIFCRYLQKKAPQLTHPPYPGIIGEILFKEISEPAWTHWLVEQTKIINENRLNPLDRNDRQRIEKALINFFGIQDLIA